MVSKALIIIPARGGSKGIPRKNLRPLCGKPLIYYAISAANQVDDAVCVVTTEDEEIAFYAQKYGAGTVKRPQKLANDEVTIDPVVSHALKAFEKSTGCKFDVVITIQPTSPLIEATDIASAIDMLRKDPSIETVVSVTDDRHLRWRREGNNIIPEYEKRVNRQQLPMTYRETGALIGCRREILENGSRIGETVGLLIMPAERSIDIDDIHDFWLCEKIMSRKKVVFVVTGNRSVGMGHVYRGIMIAHELINFDVFFVCCEEDDLSVDLIKRHNYPVTVTPREKLLENILSLKPHMVINDILDTSADYVLTLKKAGSVVVNFEDLGLGAEVADLVINALYPYQLPREQILVGPRYFCLRDEFLHSAPRQINSRVERIIITFGGVDEGDLTGRVLGLIAGALCDSGIAIDVILGPGYMFRERLEQKMFEGRSPNITIVKATATISDYMGRADIAVTSAGRTVFELASLGVPTIVISQNRRETMHMFASSENGILNLGLRTDISDEFILENILKVIRDASLRKTMHDRLMKMNLRTGKQRVINKITSLFVEGRSAE